MSKLQGNVGHSMEAPLAQETRRLESLRRYEILDTEPDEGISELTKLAAQICGAPIALVSLVDAHRQWFLSRVGVEMAETPLEVSFCVHAIKGPDLMEVRDATTDPRFLDNPLVNAEGGVRFYAGVPLKSDENLNLGTLCVIDRVPRALSPEQKEVLMCLGRQVIWRLEMRRVAREQARRIAFQEAVLQHNASAIIATDAEGTIVAFNPAASQLLGYTEKEVVGVVSPVAFHDPGEIEQRAAALKRELGKDSLSPLDVLFAGARSAQSEEREWTYIQKDGTRLPVLLRVRALQEGEQLVGYIGIVRDQSERKRAELAQRDMEAVLRLMVESVKDYAIFMLDPSGRIQSWNAGAQRIKGYSAAEIIGEHFSRFYGSEDVANGKPAWELAVATEQGVFEEEGWRIRKDGSQFMANVVITAVRGGDGAVVGFAKVTRDITERKLAEEAMRESERFMRSLLNALPAAIAVLDGEARIVATNRAWASFAGELAGVPLAWRGEGTNYGAACELAATQGGAAAEFASARLRELIAGERVQTDFEHATKGAEGNIWHLCRMVRFPGEGPVRIAIVHEDITAIKAAQEKAEKNEMQFRDLFEFAPDAIVMTDGQGLITLVNRQAETLFGYDRSELSGNPVEMLMPDAPRRGHVAMREKYLATAVPRAMGGGRSDLRGQKKDGTIFPVDISLSPLESERGRLVVAAVRDISERVRAEQEMRQALAMLDGIREGAFIFEPDSLRYVYVNRGGCQQLGYSREQMLGLTPVDILPEYDEQRLRTFLAPLLEHQEGALHVTTCHRCKAGHELPVEISLQVVKGHGGSLRFIAIARDISERLNHEKDERRAQRLESIGTLAGGVAHDLNNALAPVLMACGLLRNRFPAAADLVDQMESSAQRGADMVRQLLTFAKGVEGARRAVQPVTLLREIESIIRNTFPKSIELKTAFGEDLQGIVCDSTQMHQVLLNLCVNARDAMPEGGILTLEADSTFIDAAFASAVPEAQAGPHVVWHVRDTGPGIPAEVQERMFEPFFSTKGPDKGTGLGLSTVLGIVRSHGGFVRVQSAPGEGACFSVYLPAGEVASTVPPPTTASDPPLQGAGAVVLVVDDEITVRHVIDAVLSELGFTVLTAADGTEALAQLLQGKRDVSMVITDVQMPNMDGLTLLKTLKRMLPEMKTVVMSGRLDERHRQEFNALGVSCVLDKPFTHGKLLEVVKDVMAL